MSKPTGKLAFAYQTIASMEARIDALLAERDGLLEWAVERWHAEVANRPLINVHRRSLDDTWRQIIRHLGGDTGLLCGPDHSTLLALQGEQP